MIDLVKKIKESFFDKNLISVTTTIFENKEFYVIQKYGTNDKKEQFIKNLEENINKPLSEKNFNFISGEMKGFKRTLIQQYIKQGDINEFENAYHTFFKNLKVKELFNNFHIKADYNRITPVNHQNQPFILFLLKQDYTKNINFNHKEIVESLSFNFNSKNNYLELKESLYMFLQKNYSKTKEGYLKYYKNSSKEELELEKSFDLLIYEKIKKHIKEEDLNYYKDFWKSILIKEKATKFLIEPKEIFYVFDIQYAYISERFSSINNSMYAKEACEFVSNFISNQFSEDVSISIIKKEDLFSQFVCEFKNKNINKENIQEIIIKSFNLFENCKLTQHKYIRNEYLNIFEDTIKEIKKDISYFNLNGDLKTNRNQNKKIKI